MLCTPDTSRAAIPAIFVTTESAIEVLPLSVKRSLPPVAEVLAKLPLIPLPPFFPKRRGTAPRQHPLISLPLDPTGVTYQERCRAAPCLAKILAKEPKAEAGQKENVSLRAMGSFEILDHTADVGIRAQGSSLEELFEQASRGLAEIIGIWAPVSAPKREGHLPAEQIVIDLGAKDLGGLLVDWLGEIVYLADVKESLLTHVDAEAVGEPGGAEAGGYTAAGRLWLEPRTGKQPEGTAVKAITYHRLKVAPTPAGWMAEVYVDV